MKNLVTFYAIGSSIDTKYFSRDYSDGVEKLVIGETKKKSEFDQQSLLSSFENCTALQFFPKSELAKQSALNSAVINHFDGRFITCPVIFEVILAKTFDNVNKGFPVTQINSAFVWTDPDNKFDFPLNKDMTNFTVPKENLPDLINSLSMFSFLCANHHRGIQPVGQDNPYKIPNGVIKEICEYVVGKDLNIPPPKV